MATNVLDAPSAAGYVPSAKDSGLLNHDRAASQPRLLIADDDVVVRTALLAQLSRQFEVVGMAQDGESAIDLARRQRPDVALIDVEMPAGGGLRATRGIRELSPETAIVILSVDESAQSVLEFMKAGAMTYLRKGASGQHIADRLLQSISAHQALGCQ